MATFVSRIAGVYLFIYQPLLGLVGVPITLPRLNASQVPFRHLNSLVMYSAAHI